MYIFLCILVSLCGYYAQINVGTTIPPKVQDALKNTDGSEVKRMLNRTRRIINGNDARERPYMVYLKLPVSNPKYKDYRGWLCGGVIVHEEYVLTSAACIEDAKYFYIVSGTYRHDERDDRYNNLCIKNGAKRAIWKCIPRNYEFDGHENDNIRWMNNDIAIVKVEDEFDFTRRVKGCDFIPQPICYNNRTSKLEEPGTVVSIAGWGSVARYSEPGGSNHNMLEADVELISKETCKKRWGKRYHNIIDNYMICSKDLHMDPSQQCQEKYVDCTAVDDSNEDGDRRVLNPKNLVLHSAHHNHTRRQGSFGGICENDHGSPLVYGSGVNAVVIGIISACLVKERTNECYGPFLYTSIYKNRNLISCAIYKDIVSDCNKLFRAQETHVEEKISWVDHPDGPAKNELPLIQRRKPEEKWTTNYATKDHKTLDTPIEHPGLVFRSYDNTFRDKVNTFKAKVNTSQDKVNTTQDGVNTPEVKVNTSQVKELKDKAVHHHGVLVSADANENQGTSQKPFN